MSNGESAGCVMTLLVALQVAAWVGSGFLAWKWTTPDTFFEALAFLLLWGVLGYVGSLIAGLISAALLNKLN